MSSRKVSNHSRARSLRASSAVTSDARSLVSIGFACVTGGATSSSRVRSSLLEVTGMEGEVKSGLDRSQSFRQARTMLRGSWSEGFCALRQFDRGVVLDKPRRRCKKARGACWP